MKVYLPENINFTWLSMGETETLVIKCFWDILPKYNLILYIEFYKVFDIRDKIIFLPKRNQKNASK